jgi:aconitate hydratase
VIAAITSCTNTSNPSVLMAAGLLAKSGRAGAKTSAVGQSLAGAGFQSGVGLSGAGQTDAVSRRAGFNLVGYGCTTCIGNSGPLPEPIEAAIKQGDLTVGAVLSGNRNFEGRIHPLVKTNWLASPPLVVAYALAGNMNINLVTDPIGHDRKNDPVYLKDIWPSSGDRPAVEQVSTEMFRKEYAEVFEGTPEWKAINVVGSDTYDWQDDSTYIRLSPFFDEMGRA